MAAMIRNALLRSPAASLRSGAVAAVEARLAGAHPLLQLLPASSSPSSRAMHHLAGGSPSLAPTSAAAMITRRNASTAEQIERTRELVEEKKAALLQQLLKEEEKGSPLDSSKEKKAKAEELLALIRRQVASGVEQDKDSILTATLLARSLRSDKAIEELKADVLSLKEHMLVRSGVFYAGAFMCFFYWFSH